MRLLLGAVGAAALGCALAACAAIAGLGPYTSEDCPADGCDASVRTIPHEGAVGTGTDGSTTGDDTDGGSEDGGVEGGGCQEGMLACDGGCLNPSSSSSCGSCGNACGGDAALCAPADDASFACVSTCPSTSSTECEGTCSNPSSDPYNCSTCGNACSTTVANAHAGCADGGCTFACDTNYTACGGGCVDFMNDPSNCGGCGATFACAEGLACSGGVCMPEGGAGDSGIPCPDGGCPNSTATGFSCPTLGTCNGTSNQCATSGGCFCSNDNQCKSGKCVKVDRENDVSCGSNCSGSGSRDGFDCELASPGIPSLGTGGTYSCPSKSGYENTTLSCDPTHTNCYCTADSQCTTGKCIPSSNNANCSPGGPCTGSGTADYRGCEPTTVIGGCPIYIGCPANTLCQYPICYCDADVACESGHCIPSVHNGNCTGCTGTGTDDGHGCEPAPTSVACVGTGGSSCVTTLTPAPVINSGKTACLCVADSDCSSGKCVNHDSQCMAGMCTGSGAADSEDCQTATSVANAWSCSFGNCDNVSSPTGQCTAAGVPCWCTSDSLCPSGTQCATWSGCASGSCTGSGAGNAFHCAP
jgi:hypothetical protein